MPGFSDDYALSDAQKLIWTNENVYPDSPLGNVAGIALFRAAVDGEILHEALRRFLEQTEAFRTRFIMTSGVLRQTFDPSLPIALDVLDFSQAADPNAAMESWGEAEAKVPINLILGNPYKAALVKVSDTRFGIFIKVHHILADAYALFLLFKGVTTLYIQVMEGKDEPSFRTFGQQSILNGEKTYRASELFAKDEVYWKETLVNYKPENLVQKDLRDMSPAADRVSVLLQESEFKPLAEWMQARRISTFRGFMGLFCYAMGRISGEDTIKVGWPFINRNNKADMLTFGMRVNTLPFQTRIEKSEPFEEFMQRTSVQLEGMIAHARYPFHEMHGLYGKGRHVDFDLGLSYQNASFDKNFLGDGVDLKWLFTGAEMNALTLNVSDRQSDHRLLLDFHYRQQVFSHSQMLSLADYMRFTIRSVLSRSEGRSTLSDLSAQYPAPQQARQPCKAIYKPLIETFRTIAAAKGSSPALEFPGGSLSYRNLERCAAALGRLLAAKGFSKGDKAVILCHREPAFIVSMLACLSQGIAYVPLAVDTPMERLLEILEATACRVILSAAGAIDRLDALRDGNLDIMDVAVEELSKADGATQELLSLAAEDDIAYIIFTSGSTGKPKGVPIAHRALQSYLNWGLQRYSWGEALSYPLFTSVAFDLSVTAQYLPLLSGGTVFLYSERQWDDERALQDIVRNPRINSIKLTPGHLMLLADLGLHSASLKFFVVGGEQLTCEVCQRLVASYGSGVTIVNEYGPTEATVGCMNYTFNPAIHKHGVLSIGFPIQEVALRITNAWGHSQAVSFPGELEIAGLILTPGYLNEEENRKVFTLADGVRWYRTGDLVRLEGGDIFFIQRKDKQVKIRGYRVELAEIEQVYRQHDAILDAVVPVLEINKRPMLVLFYQSGRSLDSSELTAFGARRLPAYMLPSFFERCERIPLTSNGKTDTKALEALFQAGRKKQVEPAGEQRHLEGMARDLKAVLQEVLGLEDIDFKAKFLMLGANSIDAIRVISLLRSRGIEGRMQDILSSESIEAFLRSCRRASSRRNLTSLDKTELPGFMPMMDWFFKQDLNEPSFYLQSVLLDVVKPMPETEILKAIQAVMEVHPGLYLHFDPKGHHASFQKPSDPSDWFQVRNLVWKQLGSAAKAELMKQTATECKATIDLNKGSLFRAFFIASDSNETFLLLTAHHLLVDVVSWQILIGDLESYLSGANPDEALERLVPEHHGVDKIAAHYKVYLDNLPNQTLSLWQKREDARVASAINAVPAAAERFQLDVPSETLSRMRTHQPTLNLQSYELILLGIMLAASDCLERFLVCCEIETHGRFEWQPEWDLTREVGWFTSMYPITIDASRPVADLLVDFKDSWRSVRDLGLAYSLLRQHHDSTGFKHHKEAASLLRFNYLGQHADRQQGNVFRKSAYDHGADSSSANLQAVGWDIIAFDQDGGCRLVVSARNDILPSHQIDVFIATIQEKWELILQTLAEWSRPRWTASDFPYADLTLSDVEVLFGGSHDET